jgi:hypothetical protein
MTRADAWWAAALVLAATICGVLAHRLSVTREVTRTELAQLTALRESVLKLETAVATSAPVSQPPIVQAPQSDPVEPAVPRLSPQEARRAYRAAQAKMYADPKARAILRLQEKSQLRAQYPDLRRIVKLSTEEEDRLLDLLAEQMLMQTEIYINSPDERQFDGQLFEEQQRVHEVEHMTLLGPDKYDRFKRYAETLADRQRVRQFRRELSAEDDLTDEAAERLIEVVAADRKVEEEEHRKLAETGDRMTFFSGYPRSMYIEHGEDGLEKTAGALEDSDRRLARSASSVLDTSQQQHFTEFLRRSREIALSFAQENVQSK